MSVLTAAATSAVKDEKTTTKIGHLTTEQNALLKRIFTGRQPATKEGQTGAYGSIASVFNAARKLDKSLKYEQVKNFIENQTGQIRAKRFRYSTFPRSMPLRFAYDTPKPRNSMSMDVMWLVDGGLWPFAVIGIDNFTNFGYIYPSGKNNAAQAVKALRQFISPAANMGIRADLKVLYSDNGSEFIAKEFKLFVQQMGIKHYYLSG